MIPLIAGGETPRQQTEDQQRPERCLHGHIGESQTAGPLPIDLDRFIHPMERVRAHGAVLADPLDVQQTSIGLEAQPPPGGQVGQPLADAEFAWVVDRGLGPQGAALLVILLDPRPLGVDVQRRGHPLSEHARPEPPGRPLGDPPVDEGLTWD
jgi:hypothetical protein